MPLDPWFWSDDFKIGVLVVVAVAMLLLAAALLGFAGLDLW